MDYWYRLTLQLPEVHILALSADCNTLSCVLRNKEDERDPGSLFTASIAGLIAYAKRPYVCNLESDLDIWLTAPSRSSLINEGAASETGEPLWNLNKLNWPASAVTHLSFSGQDGLYLVVQPELTARSREHRINVIYVSLSKKTVVPVIIESRVSPSQPRTCCASTDLI